MRKALAKEQQVSLYKIESYTSWFVFIYFGLVFLLLLLLLHASYYPLHFIPMLFNFMCSSLFSDIFLHKCKRGKNCVFTTAIVAKYFYFILCISSTCDHLFMLLFAIPLHFSPIIIPFFSIMI